MEILYRDEDVLVCVKPAGVLSTDEPGGMPSLAREALGEPAAEICTVHRLDRVVGGLMVLARGREAAGELSRQIRSGNFRKRYLAVVHGLAPEAASLRDLMVRDKARRMSFVTQSPGKGVQEARLAHRRLECAQGMSLLLVELHTGRTHQIRCQLAHHGLPLVGERKYSSLPDDCPLALWSWALDFAHPRDGRPMGFRLAPPEQEPWLRFSRASINNL